jgi:hypothetical protein
VREPSDSTRLCTELSKSRTEPSEPKYQIKQLASRHHRIPAPHYNRTTLSPQGEANARRHEFSHLSSTGIFQIEARDHGCRGRTIATSATIPTARWCIASVICMVGRAIARGSVTPEYQSQQRRHIGADHPLAIVKGKLIRHELARRSRASA